VAPAAVEAGRDPSAIGLEGRVSWGEGGAGTLTDHAGAGGRSAPPTCRSTPMNAGLASVDAHLEALTTAAEVLEVDGS